MNGPASIAVTHDADLVVVTIDGEIDLANASELEGEILGAVPNGAAGLVLDLGALTYLDSRGVRLLLSVAGRLGWRGQGFALAAPAESRCRRVLTLAGADGAFPSGSSVGDASALLRASLGTGNA
ncbi:MAG TPA: STAS domain-containing protein [Actinomycetota bacterium]|nr:STAS domain-containing protein [Actinomycetota bacterium]